MGWLTVITCLFWAIFGINHPHDFWKFWNGLHFTWTKSRFSKIRSGHLSQIVLPNMWSLVLITNNKEHGQSGEISYHLRNRTLFVFRDFFFFRLVYVFVRNRLQISLLRNYAKLSELIHFYSTWELSQNFKGGLSGRMT